MNDEADGSDAGVLWRTSTSPRRGPKPRYTLDGIAAAAMSIADEDGLEAVTMQQVAARLGTTKMALYRYLPGRSDLDAVMLDRALGPSPAVEPGDWAEGLTVWTRTLFTRALAHPWAVELAQRPHLPGPEEMTWFETGLEATASLPLESGERLDLLALLSGHALSLVRQRVGSATPEEDLAGRTAAIFAHHRERYPRTASAFVEAGREGSRDAALDFGVERILAGTAALVAERRSAD
ncbi:TetR/AcrR family transcriptional regulator [Gordonia neofelifaecis]|uniref:Transcriptional regulator, TetR family protein n=1 Tax=Gordonia neofelifaecis NRRL B-59395 TaxID=644548 RepID=F1YLD0_9ACTN|nr:TetR/AcrR family transcriptional regulator [Gordonia neofelifaecis]EGD54590.1 transcriptional regulator, TetR family protein [Gordonia neofelifaecis NRRL B-59395]